MASTGGVPEGGGAWAAIARKDAAVQPKLDIPSLLSTAGLKTLVVDANALIGGGVKLHGIADQFFTIREVLDEVRDPASRFHLATLPVSIRCLEPSDEALAAVIKFSRATGDLQTLSEVDLKLIALTYTLEAQAHGTAHIRSRPPPLLVTPSSTQRHLDPPGWGTVENPEEWEGIEEDDSGAAKTESRILGLQTLNLNFTGNSVDTSAIRSNEERQDEPRDDDTGDDFLDGTPPVGKVEDHLASSALEHKKSPALSEEKQSSEKSEETQESRLIKVAQKPSPTFDGSLKVVRGVDASKGAVEEDDDDWQRASSRSTRRKYLKREAKRSARRQAAESARSELPYSVRDEEVCNSVPIDAREGGIECVQEPSNNPDSCTVEDKEEVQEVATRSRDEHECPESRDLDQVEDIRLLEDGAETTDELRSNQDSASAVPADGTAFEESGKSDPLWTSSIGCMTGDYAMQNVILQMGLRLLSTSGLHIRELNKWVLKCQACNHVTSNIGRIFCPKCGNGGTLFKVSVTVGQNGTLHAGRSRRINLRGTRYSLPMPKGGREGAAQNPILREDQLFNKLFHPKPKKASDLEDLCGADLVFTVTQDKKSQKLVGVKTAAAIFGGRRNPNERRGARKH